MVFLSETNLSLHREYLRKLKLQLSVFEKSYPKIVDKSIREIKRGTLRKSEREELVRLKAEISAHEIFFSSFGESGASQTVKRAYGSEASFMYELYLAAKRHRGEGFLFVYVDKNGLPRTYLGNDYQDIIEEISPCLSIDLCEHAYFYDYYFERDKYLKSAISSLNLSKVENMVEKNKK